MCVSNDGSKVVRYKVTFVAWKVCLDIPCENFVNSPL